MKPVGTPTNPLEIKAEKALASFALLEGREMSYRSARPPVASPSYSAVESRTFDISVSGDEPDYFLRLGIHEVADLVDAETAFAAANQFHMLGFSPEPVGFDPVTRGTLFRRLGEDWHTAKIDDLMAPDTVAKLVAMQSGIARGKLLGRQWSVFTGIEQLWPIVTSGNIELPADVDWMLSWMTPIRDAIEASGIDYRPCHGDPHSSNVMLGPEGAIQLVDFDMAGDMDPYYQLGAQMNELYQFDSLMKPLLEMHDGRFSEKIFNRCRAYAAADDLYWALRSLVLELRSPPSGVEFLKYAGWRFLRCRMLLGHPDFEGRLRDM
ncbi:phosphotransferase [Rhizobium paknamense]|uniref:Thiamine kinase-like enzyme n=1 Tax=Rhizobium paknamense TaxID=1206817 RepID=A0ABU0IIX4_9HYPH|nr:phosphotransferase [Rhizobium paknamense]MDQ0458207.1 thiamine kinase-like enzyme [Rhizobium paknamense]